MKNFKNLPNADDKKLLIELFDLVDAKSSQLMNTNKKKV
jgi:hypothetical protein